MTRRPYAQVQVIHLPHLAEGAYRIEVDCRYSATGITTLPGAGGLNLGMSATITFAVYTHEERCGDCDTSRAHARGNPQIREHVEQLSVAMQAMQARRYAESRRN
jgi:hypothetical protein